MSAQAVEKQSHGLLFSGQGAQEIGMGRSFYEENASARACFDDANEILGWDLKRICFTGPDEELTQTSVCQPALYVHGMAVFRVLREGGWIAQVPPCALGLSLGEITALAAAHVLDFETGLKLVAERGRLMQEACEVTEGSMAALIGGSLETAEQLAAECDVDIGNLNCPGQIVLSGPKPGIDAAIDKARDAGFKLAKELNVAGAYHSRLMERARVGFEAFLRDIEFAPPLCPVYSNATGRQVSSPEAIKEGLVRQIVSTVRFEDNLRNAAADTGTASFYECGPAGTLAGMAKRTDRSLKVTSVSEYKDLPA